MRITHRLYETMSGNPLAIPLTATGSWNDSLTAVGGGRFRIPLALTRFTPEQWHASTYHWFHMIAEFWDDHPVFFGLIAKKTWEYDTQTLALDTVTVDDLFANRFTFGVANYQDGDLSIESQSLRAAMVQTLRRGMAWGGTWPLPFDFQAPEWEPGAFSQAWARHDWKRISDIISIIQSQENGPDIAYVPKIDAGGRARWDVLIGTPKIDGPTIDLPLSVRNTRARNPRLVEDGRRMLSGAMTRGEGFGKNRPYGWAGYLDGPPMPVRDSTRDMVANDTNLMEIAASDLVKNRGPIRQYELDLLASPDVRLGARLNLRHSGDAYTRPTSEPQYVIARSHDSSSPLMMRPEVQAL